MPQHKKNRVVERKTQRKTITNESKTTWVQLRNSVPLYPVSKRTTLRYYEFAQSVTAGVGTANSRFFSANGCYDPDISGTGHQPMGFDQMMTLYDQYTVINAKATVTFVGGNGVMCCCLYANPDTVSVTNIYQLVENGLLAQAYVDCSASTVGNQGTGERIKHVTKAIDIAQYMGRPKGKGIVNDPELHGTAAANPTEQVYFGIAAFDCVLGTGAQVFYDILIDYDIVFTEPRKLSPS